MTPRRRLNLSGAAFVLVVFAARDLQAQQFVPTGRDTMRQLPGVEVLVEPLAPELAQAGITAAGIRTNVEAQLRTAGIHLYSSQTENPSPAKAYLYVMVSGLPVPGQGFALALQVHLRQTLRSLATGSNIVNAMTWDQQVVVVVPSGTSAADVNEEVRALVAQFVRDWRAVH